MDSIILSDSKCNKKEWENGYGVGIFFSEMVDCEFVRAPQYPLPNNYYCLYIDACEHYFTTVQE